MPLFKSARILDALEDHPVIHFAHPFVTELWNLGKVGDLPWNRMRMCDHSMKVQRSWSFE